MDQRQGRLQVVEDVPDFPVDSPPAQPKPELAVAIGAQALVLGLGALSKRFLVALASLWMGFFTLSTVFSAWVLWYSIPDPSNSQLVALATYGVFVLVANVIVRRV